MRAWELLQDAYQAQMEGDYERAVDLYKSSLELHPTAEAHTFLGWAYHFQGKLDQAIAECRTAIDIDPEFGNPYNDIGAYLIECAALMTLSRGWNAPLKPNDMSPAIFLITIWAAPISVRRCTHGRLGVLKKH